ncbi:VTT domain-containing protein, partial [Myxococcota bacterium]|nr:VTT domain-containing protein [Myxococcota bacterium]
VSFASTLGATLAFLSARWLLRDAVARRWPERLALIDEGVAREGALYLFGLRLTPVFPFFIINLALGLTRMRVWTFAWVSQLGMLLGTILFVNAGTALAQLKGPSGILSPRLLLAFTLLGITPLLTKRLMSWLRARQAEAA